MSRVTRYLLALTLAVQLALPQGWCCHVRAGCCRGETTLEEPRPEAAEEGRGHDCCQGGCCPRSSEGPQPAPRRAVKCCCGERDLPQVAPPDGGVTSAAVASLLPPAADLPLPEAGTGRTAPGLLRSGLPPRSLHVLLCVWLC